MLAGGNLIADAEKYDGPVLVMCGGEDTVTPKESCRKISDAFPNAKYQTLPGVGPVAGVFKNSQH